MKRRTLPQWIPADNVLWNFDARDTDKITALAGGPIANNGTIASWVSSGASDMALGHLAGAGGPTWKSEGINGRPACAFAGTSFGALAPAGMRQMSGLTLAVVAQRAASGGEQLIASLLVTSTLPLCFVGQYTGKVEVGGRRVAGDSGSYQLVRSFPVDVPTIIVAAMNFENGTCDVYADGMRSLPRVALASSGTTVDADPYAFVLGAYPSAASPLTGNVGQVLAIPAYLTADELVPVHHYLRMGWGIS